MRARLIKIHGLAGCGKSTASKFISEYGDFEVVSYASPLKEMTEILLSRLGVSSDNIVSSIYGSQEDKERPLPEARGFSARYIMQILGSEFRDLIYPDLWVDAATSKIRGHLEANKSVINDDFRFKHEYEAALKNFPSEHVFVKILNPKCDEVADSHQSEKLLPDNLFDIIVHNNGNLDQLRCAMNLVFQFPPGKIPDSPMHIECCKISPDTELEFSSQSSHG